MKFTILILSLFLFSVSSYSQDNTNNNVEFTSDSLEIDENKNLMIAKGNVVIKSEKETIKADSVEVVKYSDLSTKYIHPKILKNSNYYKNMILKISEIEKYLNNQ